MMKHIFTLIIVALATAIPAVAQKSVGKKVSTDDLHYASISRTNPFEIVPAAGMEILEDGIVSYGDADPQMVADLLGYAKSFMGIRYVHGGKSPKGFDCSGFTSYVFSQFGYELSPSSVGQYGQGDKIGKDEIMPGDLLFFKGRNASSGRVGHVGIAVESNPVTGEVTFIHAAIGGGIRIDKISTPYYATRYVGARRVL